MSVNRETNTEQDDQLYRAKWTSEARKAYLEEHPENFAGPDESFPIRDGSDVNDAWRLAGHGDDPDSIREKIRSIAKKLGLEKSLPETAKEDAKGSSKETTTKDNEDEEDEDGTEDESEEKDTKTPERVYPSSVEAAMMRNEAKTQNDVVIDLEAVTVDRNGNHAKMTGAHKHAHSVFSQDGTHAHEHDHMDDNDHEHPHSSADMKANISNLEGEPKQDDEEDTVLKKKAKADKADSSEKSRSAPEAPQVKEVPQVEKQQEKVQTHSIPEVQTTMTSESIAVYLPITRVDATARTVTGQATVEKPDAYGTIFGYYPEAWKKWRGNMREQHDPKKAVGKAIEVIPDDQERAIYVTSKVSRGAQDTWMKIEDGVLTGYSASIIPDPEFGNVPSMWPKKEYNGKQYPYLPRYTVAETSYVDNPATPGCDITLVRADGFITDVLDDEEEVKQPADQENLERAGARVGTQTKTKMHDSIGHTLQAAKSQMQNCSCPTCNAAVKVLDPDSDGDIDFGGYDDPDHDPSMPDSSSMKDTEREVIGLIERSLSPVYTRLQSIAGALAKSNTQSVNIEQIVTSSITRAFEAFDAKLASLPTQTLLDEVRSELSEVKDRVIKIAEQPMPGGPVFNANVIEKRLATQEEPKQRDPSYGSVYNAIREINSRGGLDTVDKQVEAMALGLNAQRPGR